MNIEGEEEDQQSLHHSDSDVSDAPSEAGVSEGPSRPESAGDNFLQRLSSKAMTFFKGDAFGEGNKENSHHHSSRGDGESDLPREEADADDASAKLHKQRSHHRSDRDDAESDSPSDGDEGAQA